MKCEYITEQHKAVVILYTSYRRVSTYCILNALIRWKHGCSCRRFVGNSQCSLCDIAGLALEARRREMSKEEVKVEVSDRRGQSRTRGKDFSGYRDGEG